MEGSVDGMSLAGEVKVNEEDHVDEIFDSGVFPALAWPGVGVQPFLEEGILVSGASPDAAGWQAQVNVQHLGAGSEQVRVREN